MKAAAFYDPERIEYDRDLLRQFYRKNGFPDARVVALDELLSAGGDKSGSSTVMDTIADRAHDPVEAFEVDEMKHLLADAINRMPDRERLVLTLYYYEGLTLAEIGGVLGVTESRVCQIHTKAILQLRSRLQDPPG